LHAAFFAQGGPPTAASVVAVSLPNAAFLYMRSSLEAPSHTDMSRLTFVTNSLFMEMYSDIFASFHSAGFLSADITAFTELREDFVNFQVTVNFDAASEAIPDVKQLLEIAHEELTPGTAHYDQYLTRLRENESPVLSSTNEFLFVSTQAQIDSILADESYVPATKASVGGKGTETEEESKKPNLVLHLILIGCIVLAAAGWFSYRRRINRRRPMVTHNLMGLKGDRDDSTVATYQPTVYTEEALKKVRGGDKPPTMEELEEASLGEYSDSSSSMPSLSPPPSPGVAATSRKAAKQQDSRMKKPSWTSRSIANSDRSDDDAAITTPMFSTPVSVAESQSEGTSVAPSMEPVTYDFADATPRGRISRKKKYAKASARIARGERPDPHDLKSNQRPVVTNSIRAANEPSLSMPDLKMTDLMMETTCIDHPQASYLSLRRVASHDDDASVDVIVSNECMEPSSFVAPSASSAPTARTLSMADNADEQVGKNGLVGHEGPTADHQQQLVEKDPTTQPDEGKFGAPNAKQNEPDVAEMTAPTDYVAPFDPNTPKAENKKKLSAAVVDPSGFPASPYIVADKDLPEWMRKFKQMGLDTVAEPHGRP
jgi:hypothetical protein